MKGKHKGSARRWYGHSHNQPPTVVETNGLKVHPPAVEDGCWGIVIRPWMAKGRGHMCTHFARKDKLCCTQHRRVEADARKLSEQEVVDERRDIGVSEGGAG